jgi:hypothetical protein
MNSPKRLVLIDTYVVLYNIVHRAIEAYGEIPDGFLMYGEAALEWVNSLAWFPGLAKRDAIAVWVVDSAPYWRSDYHPDYKAARIPKPPVFDGLREKFWEMDFRVLHRPGYEADDVAAGVVQLWRDRRLEVDQVFLATCDSDWQGLVCQPDVFWVDVAGYTPRVRQRTEIYNWLCSKWAKQSSYLRGQWQPPDPAEFTCRHIWEWKRATGDTSDNLPPRSPLYLIDLLDPLPQFRLWNDAQFLADVVHQLDRERLEILPLSKAEQRMAMLGLTPPISAIDEFNALMFTPVL